MATARVIYWFRTDLRLHDSPALKAALELDPECFWPVWTWDPHYIYRARVGVNRWQFLIDCQNDLSKSITTINKNSKLFVIREAPQTLFPKLFKAWKITHLVFEKDTDAYARDRDTTIMKAAKEAGVEVVVRSGRTLWDSDELVIKNNHKPTMSITQVQNAGPKVGVIPRPIPAPESFPDPGPSSFNFEQEAPPANPDFNAGLRSDGAKDKSYSQLAGPNQDFAPPTLEELGFPAATTSHRGGETIALKALEKVIANEEYTATFEKPKTSPAAFEPQATTLLSPHLHFGSLSIREFYWRVQDVVAKYNKEKGKGKASEPPVSLTGQLLFRDMYFGAQASLGYSFGQISHNSHCRFIPWHLQSNVNPSSGIVTGEYHIDSAEAEEWFQRWKWGRTGFPWIDAIMRQLRMEGWIHHLARHAVACFLTRGGCYVSWERGAEVFEEWLIDHETACNAGNWQWLSCSAFYAQFFRMYSPIAFGQKWDKEGLFIRKYIPNLSKIPAKYIYEPSKAPLADLKKAGVVLKAYDGKPGDGEGEEGVYLKPMFDFSERRKICLEKMKEAYRVGIYGDDARVVDGGAEGLFGDGGAEGGGKDVKSEDGEEAAETGGDSKDGDVGGSKRKRGQGTLDGFATPVKKKR